MSAAKPEKPKTQRRDHLRDIEVKVQQQWAEAKLFEMDAPAAGTDEAKKEHYLVTFPYPYMNGVLHLGHAFTITKAEFAARYQRLLGKHVLFPFGFHCTGMPIAACADKLKNEIAQFGNPPTFPEEEEQKKIDASKKAAKSLDPSKRKNKKGKAAKKKSGLKYQWQIMREMGLPEEDIAGFADSMKWLSYFPPIARDDLKDFGAAIDFRRSFITTEANPYYDAFIRWQFNTLSKKNKIGFGKRLCVYSTVTQQPCADHDRKKGEGVGPQEYTLIKIKLCKPYPDVLSEFGDKTVVLPAATLRPETMYGQTNVFLLPDGEYGVFEMDKDEVFVCSQRAALNMSYQSLTPKFGEPELRKTVKGRDLIGHAVTAPLCQYEKVYLLPLLTISMGKGTGVVTSVPSDAPDDYQALKDLKKNVGKIRDKYGITPEMVEPFDVVEIIDIPGLGKASAARLCEEQKVKNQHDKAKLAAIKQRVYMDGFYKGVLVVGPHKGTKVEHAKTIIRDELIASNDALTYSEPVRVCVCVWCPSFLFVFITFVPQESTVISRHGDECVVAAADQYFLKYGSADPAWQNLIKGHIDSVLECYNPIAKKMFQETAGWLNEWACSRSYGLGTKLPEHPEFVIESLSDSTIYMAYYTIAHFLQGGVLDGSQMGSAQISADKLSDDVFNYVFLNDKFPDYPKDCGIPQETLDRMRHEFSFWYPMNLRVSGKDLIKNHLTMSLYNHAAIWEHRPDYWPRSFYTNGHLNINKEKMSKSTGNFITLKDAIRTYSADATRFGLADAGDSLMDANFDKEQANATILRLTKEETWIEETYAALDKLPTDVVSAYHDNVFTNDMNSCIHEAKAAFDGMQFHEALKAGHFELLNARDNYRAAVGEKNMTRALVERFVETFLVILSPICPHLTQSLWERIGKQGFIINASWPVADPVDATLRRQSQYLAEVSHNVVSNLQKQRAKKKQNFNVVNIFVATSYPEAQQEILSFMKAHFDEHKQSAQPQDVLKHISSKGLIKTKKDKKTFMAFTAQIRRAAEVKGAAAFETSMPFDEVAFLKEHIQSSLHEPSVTRVSVFLNTEGPEFAKKDQAAPGKPIPQFVVE